MQEDKPYGSDQIADAAIARVIEVAQEAAALNVEKLDFVGEGPQALLVREDQRPKVLDLSEYLDRYAPRPRRTTGRVRVFTVQSLLEYVGRHLDSAGTTVWVPPGIPPHGEPTIVAVLNDHEGADGEGGGWGDHRAELALQVTDAWRHWLSLDNQLVSQEKFAEHIEDGQIDIAKPDGADLLEIVQTFQQTTSSTLRSATRLTSGLMQFEYVQDGDAKAGVNGDIEIPATFDLALAPFIGEPAVSLTARLRYRTNDGKLRIGYKLDRPADVARDALERIAVHLGAKLPAVYIGAPRS